MKIAEIKELATKELQERLYDQMRINHAVSPLDSPAKLKHQRRMIAQMKTVLRQRELNK